MYLQIYLTFDGTRVCDTPDLIVACWTCSTRDSDYTTEQPPMAVRPITSAQSAVRLSYVGISIIFRRQFSRSTLRCAEERFHRSDFHGDGFTGVYEPGPTEGPLKDASNIGVPKITPRTLKEHLDQFVVGQERAKKILSVAVYNHYQRIQELDRQDEEMAEMAAQQQRRERARDVTHPLEGRGPLKREFVYVI